MLFNAVGVEKESSASKNDFNPNDLAAQASPRAVRSHSARGESTAGGRHATFRTARLDNLETLYGVGGEPSSRRRRSC